jgi:hypothetical protein
MTLTDASHWTKRFGVIFGVFIVLFIIVTLIVVTINKSKTIDDYLKPDFACTDTSTEFLKSRLTIPSLTLADGSNSVFELETETGKVDALPRVANVHKFSVTGQSLNSQGEAKIIAQKLGFNPSLIQRGGSSTYVWSKSKTYQSLTIYARNLNFDLTTDFTKTGSIDSSLALPSETEAISIATNYLKGKGLLFEDYFKASPEAVNINITPNGAFTQARSRSEAELIRVDFYREKPLISIRSDYVDAKKIKDTLEKKLFQSTTDSIVTDSGRVDIYNFDTIVAFQNPNEPNISVYVGPKNAKITDNDTNKNVYQVHFVYWPVDSQPCGTYTLISPQTALQIVQKGEGSLAYLNEKNGDDVVAYTPQKVTKFTIFTITLGYFEPKEESSFMQPIYIISGEATLSTGVIGKFHYYVPAIDYSLVKNKVVSKAITPSSTSLF